MTTKVCTNKKCVFAGQEQSLDNFHKDKTTKDGYRFWCKTCIKKNNTVWYENNKIEILQKQQEHYKENKEEILPKNRRYKEQHKEETKEYQKQWYQKNKKRLSKKGKHYRETHKEELKEKSKVWRQLPENKEKERQWHQEWRAKNKEKNADRAREYYQKNREKIIKKQYLRKKKKLEEDIEFRLAERLRNRLYCAIKDDQKTGSAVRDMGCSIKELRLRFEQMFPLNPIHPILGPMSWENQGRKNGIMGWDIDHIIPLSAFDLTDREQLLKAAHYTNLRPMWAKQNISEGDRGMSLRRKKKVV